MNDIKTQQDSLKERLKNRKIKKNDVTDANSEQNLFVMRKSVSMAQVDIKKLDAGITTPVA